MNIFTIKYGIRFKDYAIVEWTLIESDEQWADDVQ